MKRFRITFIFGGMTEITGHDLPSALASYLHYHPEETENIYKVEEV